MNLRCVVLSFVVLLIAAASTGTVAAQQDPTPGVVKILARVDGDDREREGSGFVVGFDRGLTFIATAAHVVEGASRPNVIFAAAPHLTYEATTIQAASDIAVLKVFGFVPGTISLPLDQRTVQPADPLQAIGFPNRARQPRWSTAGASSREGTRIVLDEHLPEGNSGGPLLREGWVVGLINETEADFAYATPALILGQILASWKVPFQLQTTQKLAPTRDSRPDDTGSGFGGTPSLSGTQVPVGTQVPGNAVCFGVVVSSTGSGQPVRNLASRSAQALSSLPAGARVAVEASQPGDGTRWYLVASDNQRGWMQKDHLKLSQGCPE